MSGLSVEVNACAVCPFMKEKWDEYRFKAKAHPWVYSCGHPSRKGAALPIIQDTNTPMPDCPLNKGPTTVKLQVLPGSHQY